MKPGILYYNANELRGGLPQLLANAESIPELEVDYGWCYVVASGDRSPTTNHYEYVLVEHKSLSDLSQSLRNGRLTSELERAKAETPFVYLAQTGFAGWYALRDLGWDYGAFQDALFAKLHGLQVGGPLVGANKAETAENIMALFRQTTRVQLGQGRPVLPKWKTTKPFDQAEAYKRALPGLGWDKAEALAKAAPSWEALVSALRKDKAQWLRDNVDGIGPIMAKRIWERVMGAY